MKDHCLAVASAENQVSFDIQLLRDSLLEAVVSANLRERTCCVCFVILRFLTP